MFLKSNLEGVKIDNFLIDPEDMRSECVWTSKLSVLAGLY